MSSEWVTDRAPTYDEVKDHELAYVTIEQDALGVVSRRVAQMSGFMVRTYLGEQFRYAQTMLAWYSPPQPWDEEAEAKEAAQVVAAMRDDAKARNMIGKS
jgi:hypothetical protein